VGLDIYNEQRLSTLWTLTALLPFYDLLPNLLEQKHRTMKDLNEQIIGVEIKSLVSHPDDRGFFREIIRNNDPFFNNGFAQWSHSKMAKNTVKAWHFHHRQTDWWYLPIGLIDTVLIDNREESPTFGNKIVIPLGETSFSDQAQTAVVKIPPGVLHGCKVMSPEAHLFYITSQVYDPQDEGRLPYNSEKVDHFWGDAEELIVSPRDTIEHIPPYERAR